MLRATLSSALAKFDTDAACSSSRLVSAAGAMRSLVSLPFAVCRGKASAVPSQLRLRTVASGPWLPPTSPIKELHLQSFIHAQRTRPTAAPRDGMPRFRVDQRFLSVTLRLDPGRKNVSRSGLVVMASTYSDNPPPRMLTLWARISPPGRTSGSIFFR